MLEGVEKGASWVSRLVTWLRPPIRVAIVSLKFVEIVNRPGDPVVVITPYPRCYFARLELVNWSNRTAYVHRVFLAINGSRKRGVLSNPIEMAAGQPKTEAIEFPLEDNEHAVEKGDFIIEVVPTVGRRATSKGRFPLLEDGDNNGNEQ